MSAGTRLLNAGLSNRELVAAKPRDGIDLAHHAAQAVCHFVQQTVADRMTKRIVHRLELVEVQIQHCQTSLPAAHPAQKTGDVVAERHAVRQARFRVRIMPRNVIELYSVTLQAPRWFLQQIDRQQVSKRRVA